MSKENLLKKAEKIAGNLALRKIHLWESNFKRDISFKPKKAQVSIDAEVKDLKSENGKMIPFACRFLLNGIDVESDKNAFNIDVTFCLLYEKINDCKISKVEKEAFGLTSAVFNAWPYAREFVHNTLARMDLSSFVMPPITISELAKNAKKSK